MGADRRTNAERYYTVHPEEHRAIALGVAGGQLWRAGEYLAGRDYRSIHHRSMPPLVLALEHMRSAVGWLREAA